MSLLRARGKLFCAHFLQISTAIPLSSQFSFLAHQSMTFFFLKMIMNNFYADDIQIRAVNLSQGSAQNREFSWWNRRNRENLWSQLSTEPKNASPFLYYKRRILLDFFLIPEKLGWQNVKFFFGRREYHLSFLLARWSCEITLVVTFHTLIF